MSEKKADEKILASLEALQQKAMEFHRWCRHQHGDGSLTTVGALDIHAHIETILGLFAESKQS